MSRPSGTVVPRRLLAVLCAVQAGAACADPPAPDTPEVRVVDSAGVPVVHNPTEGAWGPGEGWSLAEALRIGGEDVEFGQIVGLDVADDGRVYVADMQAREIRVFGPGGEPLLRFGQAGSGPGELGLAIAGPFVHGDEVRVPDLQNQRVSRFSLAGEPRGSVRLDFAALGVPVRWDEDAEGRLVVQLRSMGPMGTGDGGGDLLVLLGDDGSPADTLGVLPEGASVQMAGGDFRMRMFDAEPVWDLGPDGTLVAGRNHTYRLEVRGAEGEVARVVTRPSQPRPITERDREAFLGAMEEAAEAQGVPQQALDQIRSRMTFADHYPAFASLLLGPDGSLWVQRLRTGEELVDPEGAFDPGEMGSDEWEVFDGEGRYLGVVSFPPRFQPLRFVGDRVWGVARDDLDVQSLAAYRVVR